MASSRLMSTNNHVYFKEDLVAQGSTCEVYKGYNKLTGEVRALKILNSQYNHGSAISLQRETEALLRLQHPNIVTFYSLEKESLARKNVLVTEFCSGGTLSNFLRKPENFNGLTDEEFLIFFNDIVCGMKHLRRNGFVHRDIKPPNILRCQIDRKTVYKLTDFGTAKPLQDEEEFMSLVGTEEYLHPDIYEAVFFKKSQAFTAMADLWSLGATLYHSASGLPPFIPYGGRANHTDMFQMLTNKQSGMVSGIQKLPGGDIEWSNDLPESVMMSHELKYLVLPLIAGLLEKAPDKMWTFDKFFRYADEIIEMIHLKVVDPIKPDFINLFLKPTACCNEINQKLQMYCNIEPQHQRLFYRSHLLSEYLKQTDPIQKFTTISISKPIILISNQPFDVINQLHMEIDVLPEFGPSNKEDLKTATILCDIASQLVREAKLTSQIMKQLCKTSKDLRHYQSTLLDQRTTLLTGKKEWFFGILSATGLDELSQHIFVEEELESFVNIRYKFGNCTDSDRASELVYKIKRMIEVCDNHANYLQKMCSSTTELQEFLKSKDNCFHENRCFNILTDLMDDTKEGLTFLVSLNSKHAVTQHGLSQFKEIRKKQLYSSVKDIVNRVTKHCFPLNQKIFTVYHKYHQDYLETERQLTEMYDEIKSLTENIQELNGCLTSPFIREERMIEPKLVPEKVKNKKEKKQAILRTLSKGKNKGTCKNLKSNTNTSDEFRLLEVKTDDFDSEKLQKETNDLNERLSELNLPVLYQVPKDFTDPELKCDP